MKIFHKKGDMELISDKDRYCVIPGRICAHIQGTEEGNEAEAK